MSDHDRREVRREFDTTGTAASRNTSPNSLVIPEEELFSQRTACPSQRPARELPLGVLLRN